MAVGSEETSQKDLRDRQIEAGKFIHEMPKAEAVKLHNEINLGLTWAKIGREACNEVYMSDSRERDSDQLDTVESALGGIIQFEAAEKAIRSSTVYVDLENRVRDEQGLQRNNGWVEIEERQARAVVGAIRTIMADRYRATTYGTEVEQKDVDAAKKVINDSGLLGVFVGVSTPDEVLERFGEVYMKLKPRPFKKRFVPRLA